jgi:hypothetical protein
MERWPQRESPVSLRDRTIENCNWCAKIGMAALTATLRETDRRRSGSVQRLLNDCAGRSEKWLQQRPSEDSTNHPRVLSWIVLLGLHLL